MKAVISIFLIVLLSTTDSIGHSLKVFWKIEHPETKSVSYLLGVVHLSCKIDTVEQFIKRKIEPYLEQTELLIQEPSEDLSYKEKREIMNNPDGLRLKDIYNKEDYHILTTFMKERHISTRKGNDRYLPIWLKSGLMNTYDTVKCEEVESIDNFLEDKARLYNLEMLNIETSEEVLSAVAQIPLDKQQKLLIDFCMDQSNMVIDSGTYYTDFGIDLEKIFTNTFAYYEFLGGRELAEITLNKSTDRMVERLYSILINKRTFVSVGLAFLGSSEGLIYKLEKLGFKLTMIEI